MSEGKHIIPDFYYIVSWTDSYTPKSFYSTFLLMSAANKQFRRPRLPLYMKKRPNWQPVALALIMVMLLASGILYYTASRHHASSSILQTGQQYTIFKCPYGERKTITLADSTTVLLNSRSNLYVPANYPKSGRNVILDGEAF